MISTTATATITADADLAVVHVGYKLFAPDAKTAFANAIETSNAIMAALIAAGLPKGSIESSSQVLQRTQQFDLQMFNGQQGTQERLQRAFTAAQGWLIRVKPDAAAKTLDTAINAGANESGWIEWLVEDPSALQAKASAEAFANARAAAEQMAQRAGVRIERLMTASENLNQGVIYNSSGTLSAGAGAGTITAVGGVASAQSSGVPLVINSRHIEMRATVSASFAIQ